MRVGESRNMIDPVRETAIQPTPPPDWDELDEDVLCPRCDYNLRGFSLAGVPGLLIGHNDRIAWGHTNQVGDVQDLYIERLNPENPDQYEVNGEWVDMEIRYETIGGGAPIGICGSGLIDLLAEMLREGIIDQRGRFSEPHRDANEFIVAADETRIGISQKDINELRLAKGGSPFRHGTPWNIRVERKRICPSGR